MNKNILLETDIFDDNEYLDKYLEIINNPDSNITRIKTQKHHIIPRFYFKHKKIAVNNTPDNLVILSRKNHILAHYYLCFCLNNTRSLLAASFAFMSMTREFVEDFDFSTLDKYEEIYTKWCEYDSIMSKNRQDRKITTETKTKISNAAKGRYKGDIWINKDDLRKHIPQDKLLIYLEQGWHIGRNDPQTYKKISESQKAKPNRGMLGKKQSDYQKQTVSLKLTGVKKSDKARASMREARIGKILVSNDSTLESFYIDKKDADFYLQSGFHQGRLKNNKIS